MKRILSVVLILILMLAALPVQALAAGPLKYGSSGSDVKQVQERLKKLEYYHGNIDGKFTRQVENAVKLFQNMNGLKVTGQVNAETRKKMMSNSARPRNQKKPSSSATKPAPTAKPTPSPTASAGGTLKYGMNNAAVKEMQKRLAVLGYFTDTADGKYDVQTREAVEKFQRANDLKVTGTADATTRRRMDSSSAVSLTEYYQICPVGSGDTGYAVKMVQGRLKELGYYTGSADGRYGATTVTAVKRFQDAHGLKVTGNCDYTTRKTMNSSSAKKYRPNAPAASAKPEAPAVTQKPVQTPPPASNPNAGQNSNQKIETVISAAQAQLGKPYVLGTAGMSSFDCSGLTRYCFGLVDVDLAHSAYTQGYQNLQRLDVSQLRRGDLVVFNTNTGDKDQADHVGIYLGNGTFIHASSSKRQVVISNLSDYSKSFSWGLRLL